MIEQQRGLVILYVGRAKWLLRLAIREAVTKVELSPVSVGACARLLTALLLATLVIVSAMIGCYNKKLRAL